MRYPSLINAYRLLGTPTKAQRANLEHVRLFGEAKPRSSSGYWCRTHGLSEFVWLLIDGERIGNEEWCAKYGGPHPIPPDKLLIEVFSERLTTAGLAALKGSDNG